ncbi:hypothetical protein OUZ56_000297 [Daphnia magna]|uniref:Uncharacterized protein n=1 Tax=Daphnia magna TaxID=35525 RepID=A0ABQ9ZZ94_9CRUS|nr:hypothetical protein OUZ56_000297 [Daphnia magna]
MEAKCHVTDDTTGEVKPPTFFSGSYANFYDMIFLHALSKWPRRVISSPKGSSLRWGRKKLHAVTDDYRDSTLHSAASSV